MVSLPGGDDKTADAIIMLQKVYENPVSCFLLRHFTKEDKLNSALEIYSGVRKPKNMSERIDSAVIGYVVDKGAKVFGAKDRSEFVEYFQEPQPRRGLSLVLKSIAKYGVTKPQKLMAPFLIVWDFTSICNLKCKHCYASAGKKMSGELTTKQAKEVVDQLDKAGVVAIALSGGEPLLRPDFFKIAKYIHDKGMYVSVATNGTLITKEIARKMKEAGIEYAEISLDHPDADKHDEFRGMKGAWDLTVQGIKNCVEAGILTAIATTITKHNYGRIPGMVDLALKLKVDRMIAFNFIPTRRGKEIEKIDITPEERENLLNYLYDKLEEDNGLFVFSTSPCYARISMERTIRGSQAGVAPTHFAAVPLEGKAVALADFIGGCGAGRNYCSIEYNGDIQPCVFIPIKVGNVLRDGFQNVWEHSPILNRMRDREQLQGGCSKCEYKYICGGCRARGYAHTGDIMGSDYGCVMAHNLEKKKNLEKETLEMKIKTKN